MIRESNTPFIQFLSLSLSLVCTLERKWFDFETFVSCSPKPFDFYDPFTSQYPQNTLSKFQAAFAFMRVFELTKDQRYLSVGESIVDFTSLTQQVRWLVSSIHNLV
jgi:hypothetical protein